MKGNRLRNQKQPTGRDAGIPGFVFCVLFLTGAAFAGFDDGELVLGTRTLSYTETTPGTAPGYEAAATPSGRGAVRFDGKGRYLEIGSNEEDFDGREKTTIAVFRPRSLGLKRMVSFSYATLDADESSPGNTSVHSLYTAANGAFRIENRGAEGGSIAVSTPAGSVTPGAFHIGINRWGADGSTQAVVINADGDRFTGDTSGADARPRGHLRTRVGAGGGRRPGQFFDGDLAAVLIYNRDLSGRELDAVEAFVYKTYFDPAGRGAQDRPPVKENLVAYLDVDETGVRGNRVAGMRDRSGRGNDAAVSAGEGTRVAISGTPVIPMWTAPYADPSKPAGGFPVLEEAEHYEVWRPETRGDGPFNHHAALVHHAGRFLAMWSNHPLGEDASGQRVLWATSPGGTAWNYEHELFPTPYEVRDRGARGVSLRPDRWVVVDDRCYAVAYVRWRGDSGVGNYPIAREVKPDGRLGEMFLLEPEDRDEALPRYLRGAGYRFDLEKAAAIRKVYLDRGEVSWWAHLSDHFPEPVPRRGIDKANLIEPFTYRAADGEQVLLLRFHPARGMRHNNRMYVSFRDEDGEWATQYPTDIPDSPNRTEAVVLDDGTVLLIGSQIAPELDAGDYLFRDPLTISVSSDGYRFDRVYSLRHGAPEGYRFDGIGGRTGGFAYNSSVVVDGWLYTLYSVGKEDIELTRVPLAAIRDGGE